jgi:hypothetical protein
VTKLSQSRPRPSRPRDRRAVQARGPADGAAAPAFHPASPAAQPPGAPAAPADTSAPPAPYSTSAAPRPSPLSRAPLSGTTRTNGCAIKSAARSLVCSWISSLRPPHSLGKHPDHPVIARILKRPRPPAAGHFQQVGNERVSQRGRPRLDRGVPVQLRGVRVRVIRWDQRSPTGRLGASWIRCGHGSDGAQSDEFGASAVGHDRTSWPAMTTE